MNSSWMKRPSAIVPLVMTLAALALVVVHVSVFGIVRQADEGAAARLFQLLIAGQLPIIAYFALRWLPENPRRALPILALQILVAFLAVALVMVLER